jgi:hypothetical protein
MAKMKESRGSTPVIEDDGTFPGRGCGRPDGRIERCRGLAKASDDHHSVKRDLILFGWIESVAHTPKRADTIPHQAKLRA